MSQDSRSFQLRRTHRTGADLGEAKLTQADLAMGSLYGADRGCVDLRLGKLSSDCRWMTHWSGAAGISLAIGLGGRRPSLARVPRLWYTGRILAGTPATPPALE